MSAQPILALIARLLAKHKLEAILIGNAGAALQGAPVTTVDLDFLIRRTRSNNQKLKALSVDLKATLFRPFYPSSSLVRVMRDTDTLQLDFMTEIHGVKSFEGIRSRAVKIRVDSGAELQVAALPDIIRSKRSAGRPKDLAVIHASKQQPQQPRKPSNRARAKSLAALKKASEIADRQQIAHHLALPVAARMNFLRKRIGLTATAL